MRGDRRHKLLNQGVWSAGNVLETLNLSGLLPEKEYKVLMDLKGARNSFIHAGTTITKDDSSACLDLATQILKHDLEGML